MEWVQVLRRWSAVHGEVEWDAEWVLEPVWPPNAESAPALGQWQSNAVAWVWAVAWEWVLVLVAESALVPAPWRWNAVARVPGWVPARWQWSVVRRAARRRLTSVSVPGVEWVWAVAWEWVLVPVAVWVAAPGWVAAR